MNKLTIVLAVCLAFCGMFWWGYSHKQRAEEASARAIRAELQIVEHVRTLAELDRHLEETEKQRREWERIANELEQAEGASDKLSPYLRGILDSVR